MTLASNSPSVLFADEKRMFPHQTTNEWPMLWATPFRTL